jgi:arginine decarboxylase-like protein
MTADQLLSELEHVAVIVMAVWGFWKVITEIVKNINARHDKEQRWDDMVTKSEEEKERIYAEIAKNVQIERDKIYDRYDGKLVELEQKIDATHADTEAKLQEIAAMITVLTRGQLAALDGLKQQGCNGAVTQAKKELDEFLMNRAVDL